MNSRSFLSKPRPQTKGQQPLNARRQEIIGEYRHFPPFRPCYDNNYYFNSKQFNCLIIFFCSSFLFLSACLGAPYEAIKIGFAQAFFTEHNRNASFKDHESNITRYLELFKPINGELGDKSDHLAEFLAFVYKTQVC